MLVPRFSTRAVLIVVTLCAVLFLMIGLGMRGSLWAAGVAIAAASLMFMALVHAALFGLCYAVGRPAEKRRQALGPVANPSYAAQASSPSQSSGKQAPGDTTRFSSLFVALLALPSLVGATPGAVYAGTGGIVTLPPPNVTPKSGLRITVDSTWVDNYGYLPVNVAVTSQTPATADQTIAFRFKVKNWSLGDTTPVMSVDQDIELPEGATTATATVLVPKLQEWHEVWWDVLVDGSFEKELSWSRGNMGWLNAMNQMAGSVSPRILVVADDNQPVIVSAAVLGPDAYQGQAYTIGYGGVTIQQPVQQVAPQVVNPATVGTVGISSIGFAAQKQISELPAQWLAYSSLDYLVLTPPQLQRVQEENKAAWTAIERWVRAGGNLWLHDVSDKKNAQVSGWDKLDEILETLDTLIEPPAGEPVRWIAPFSVSNVNANSVFQRESIAAQKASPLQESTRFAWRPAALGAIVVSQQSLDELDGQEWSWMQEQDGQHLGWPMRHGTVPNLPNPEFANLLIPGVGLAPVTEFRILITLFVVLIGPVNYWFLKRSKRLHLLILTVPLAALLVTLALFAYAVVGDGFGSRVRAISYTALDQRAREATSWARLSYYAGLAPSGGLEFPKDTAVYPINSAWSDDYYYGNEVKTVPRAVQWADQQYLTEGWLASRTPTQYLTIASRASDRKLQVRSDASGVQIENRLGAPIELLILRDDAGKLYVGESIAADGATTLAPVTEEAKIAGRLRGLFDERKPAFPEAFQTSANRMQALYGSTGTDYYYGGIGFVSTSRLMQRINSFTQPVDSQTPAEGGSGRSVNLDDGTYLAITTRGIDLATGLNNPDEEASFHLVEGRW
jgi:hypothetical protein